MDTDTNVIPPQAGIEMVRVFGKCPVKGCKHKLVKDVPAFRETQRDWAGRVLSTYLSPVVRHPGLETDGWYSWMAAMQDGYGVKWNPEMDGRPRCPEHRRLLAWNTMQASYNPEKLCDGRCRSAQRHICDCSCNGEQHGMDRISY